MQTIGQRLKAAREEKALTLDKVFQATRIRVNYLQALEDDDLSVMPSPVQARGYLRNYSEYLGLDLDRIIEEVRASPQYTGEIIGPADLNPPPAAPLPELVLEDEKPPPSQLTADPVQEVESSSDPESIKPRRSSGEKMEPSEQPQDELAIAAPRRHGQKKAEPAEEITPEIEPMSEKAEEATLQPKPSVETEAPGETPVDESPQPNITETLWQTWLNRVSAVISTPKNIKAKANNAPAGEESDATEIQPSLEEPPQPELPEPEDLQPETPQSSDEIFEEIGVELLKRREILNLNLEEVERNTKVKAHYLEALEQGRMDKLPSTVQTRGMLANYASFLDMDVDAILLRFADALQARHRERNPQKPVRKPGQPILANMPALRNFIAGDLIFGVGMAILLVGFVIWGINRVLTIQSQEEVQPTAPSISDVLLATPDPSLFTATATLLPVESFAEEATPTIIIPTINVNVSVQVNLIAVERTYMRVVADGEVVFEGRVIPGNAYLFEAEEQVEVLVGSGGAVRIAYNGRDLGLMGTFGQIVNNIYRADEIITPTPLATATPTNTLPPSPTLRPTNSPPPSNTPIP